MQVYFVSNALNLSFTLSLVVLQTLFLDALQTFDLLSF